MRIFLVLILVFSYGFSEPFFKEEKSGPDKNAFYAEKMASRILVFKSLYVLSPIVSKDKLLGNLFHEQVRKKLIYLKRFKVYDRNLLSKELLRTGLTHVDLDNKKVLLKMADSLGIDGFIQPVINRTKARIELKVEFLDSSGELFAEEMVKDFQYRDDESLKQVVEKLIEKLIDRIPYLGLITGVEKELYFLDIGKKDKLKQNDVVQVFEITKVKRHPVLGIFIGSEKETIGRLVLLEVGEKKSVAKLRSLKPGKLFTVNMKVSKSKIAKEPFLFPEPVKTFKKPKRSRRYKSSFGYLEARLILATFKHVSSSDNSSMDQSASVLPYPEIQFLADVWITPKWIMSLLVQGGVIPIKDEDMSPTSINAIMNSFALYGKYRFKLGRSEKGPQIMPIFGVYRFAFFPDKTTPLLITKKKYYGLSLGAEIHVPVTDKYTLTMKGIVNPLARLSEGPEKSGSKSSSMGYAFDVGARYQLLEKVILSAGLKVDYFSSSFSGSSERNTPNATSSISSIGIFGGAIIKF